LRLLGFDVGDQHALPQPLVEVLKFVARFDFHVERLAQQLRRLLRRLTWARVDRGNRLFSNGVDESLDLLPAIFAERDVECSLDAALLVVLRRAGANQKYLDHIPSRCRDYGRSVQSAVTSTVLA